MMITLSEEQQQIINTVRRFIEREVKPVASEMEHRDEYPHALVERMKELGLFGAIIPTEYGGLGVSFTTYAMIIEEICRGWMSLSGHYQFPPPLCSHRGQFRNRRTEKTPATSNG